MEYTNDALLKITGNGIWKGLDKTNGKLMTTIGVPRVTLGYSRLTVTAALLATGVNGVPFGNGVWYDRYIKATQPGTIYGGVPTAATAIPKFAGVMVLDESIMNGQPVENSVVLPMNKGKIAIRGLVQYKTAMDSSGDEIAYADINDTMNMFVDNDTGYPVVAVGSILGPSAEDAGAPASAVIEITNPTEAEITVAAGAYTYSDGVKTFGFTVGVGGIVLAAGAKSGPILMTATTVGNTAVIAPGAITITGLVAGATAVVWSVVQGRAASTAAAGALKPSLTGCTYIGPIVMLDPENEAWFVDLDF